MEAGLNHAHRAHALKLFLTNAGTSLPLCGIEVNSIASLRGKLQRTTNVEALLFVFTSIPVQHRILIADQIMYAVGFGGEHSNALAGVVAGKGFAIGEFDGPYDSAPAVPQVTGDGIFFAVSIQVVFERVRLFLLAEVEDFGTHFHDALYFLALVLFHFDCFSAFEDKSASELYRTVKIDAFIIGNNHHAPAALPLFDGRILPGIGEFIADGKAAIGQGGDEEESIGAAIAAGGSDVLYQRVEQAITVKVSFVYDLQAFVF